MSEWQYIIGERKSVFFFVPDEVADGVVMMLLQQLLHGQLDPGREVLIAEDACHPEGRLGLGEPLGQGQRVAVRPFPSPLTPQQRVNP